MYIYIYIQKSFTVHPYQFSNVLFSREVVTIQCSGFSISVLKCFKKSETKLLFEKKKRRRRRRRRRREGGELVLDGS
jgi:hypothetical protein